MAYDLYPAVDESYNFPPEVRQALSVSPELRNQVVPMSTTERNNLLGDDLWDGRLILNTDTNEIDQYDGVASQWTGFSKTDDTRYTRVDRVRNAVPLRLVRSGVDGNGVFTVVEYHRVGGNRAVRSVLSGGVSPSYTTRTVYEYDLDGTTVLQTTSYTLSYTNNQLTTETAVIV